jgi:CMP/dCMP kinase
LKRLKREGLAQHRAGKAAQKPRQLLGWVFCFFGKMRCAMTVITISRQFGSGGDEIAYQISQQLGYRLFSKPMILEVAKAAGRSEPDIIDYSEDNYQARSFLDRLFENAQFYPNAGFGTPDFMAQYNLEELRIQNEDCLNFMQKAIRLAYQAGDIVIVGRGSQVLLKNQPNAIHVRIVAPLENRIQRIKDQLKKNPQGYPPDLGHRSPYARALEIIHQRDAASADYIQRYYQVDWSDPLLYHLVLNTGKWSLQQAVKLVIQLARESSSILQ